MTFLKTILGYLDVNDKSEILESEVQRITEQVANRNTEHEKLAEFKVILQNTIEDLVRKKQRC